MALVRDRLVDKTTHQQMVMGNSPIVRWLVEGIFWSALMYIYLAVGMVVSILI